MKFIFKITKYELKNIWHCIILIIKINKDPESSIPLKILLFFVEINSIDAFAFSCLEVSKQFAVTRLITRFFDDIPSIYNLLNYLNSSLCNLAHIKFKSNENKHKKINTQKQTDPDKVKIASILCFKIFNIYFFIYT